MVNRFVSGLHNNYYRKSSKYPLKLFKISKKEYFEKSGTKEYDLYKLRRSLNPCQYNDYVLLKIPKSIASEQNTRCSFTPTTGKKYKNLYVPADYKLANIIKYLWSFNIITCGWDQGVVRFDGIDSPGFISMNHKTTNGKDVLPILIKIFGEKKYKDF